ncbi:hypothetical protein ALISP_0263 [Alicycliphilus sp. B1]|nr:hypothetical protein ALISP_0263 [Alicycliphilus sp. B1]
MAMGVAPQPAPHMAADMAHAASHGAHSGQDCCSPRRACPAPGRLHGLRRLPFGAGDPGVDAGASSRAGAAPRSRSAMRGFASAPAAQAIKPPIA